MAQIENLKDENLTLTLDIERYKILTGELPRGLDRATSVTSLTEQQCLSIEIQTDPVFNFPATLNYKSRDQRSPSHIAGKKDFGSLPHTIPLPDGTLDHSTTPHIMDNSNLNFSSYSSKLP